MIYTRQDHVDARRVATGLWVFAAVLLTVLLLGADTALADGPPIGTPAPWWMPQWLAELLGYVQWVILGVEG